MKLKVSAVAALCVSTGSLLAACQYSSPEAARQCNSPTATLDDPKMWDCYSFDRAANDRMLARKKAEIDARIKAENVGLKPQISDPIAQQSPVPACGSPSMQTGFVSTTCRP